MKRFNLSIAFLFILLLNYSFLQAQFNENKRQKESGNQTVNSFEIAKQLEIYVALFKELNNYYVNDLNPAELVKTSIDAMLKTLDPYTVYYPESEMEDARFLTTGSYGGIGALISKRGDFTQITEPYENSPAQIAGIMAGDIIKEVDGKSVKGLATDEVTALLRGQPDTEVKILLERKNVGELTITVRRAKIKIPNVPYYGMLNDSIGYLIHSSFKENSYEDIRDAIRKMMENGKLKGLIFDLRGNPGGLLIEAVRIAGLFTPKGQLIVSTKGKVESWNKEYQTYEAPLDLNIPLVFLVNENSASASEILSGAMQDLDRAVIVGSRTLGKGLVQTPRPLPYNSQLKVTTAKYYIPSGRCIQEIDYAHKGTDGKAIKVPDSLISKFYTKNGRIVFDGKGIFPDIETQKDTSPEIINFLLRENVIFDFATMYRLKHESIAPPDKFHITKNDFNEFVSFVKDNKFNFQTAAEKALEDFKNKAIKSNHFDLIQSEYEQLKTKLAQEKQNDLYRYEEKITELLENEIVSRYYYQKGRIIYTLAGDKDVSEALRILGDPERYYSILNVKK